RRILTLAREAKQAVEQFQGRMSGQLTVGGSTIPGEYVLPMLVGQFKARFPDISISLLVGSSRQINDWVEEGRVEIGVAGARPASRMLQARELMPDELVIVVPAEHAWANTKSVMLANLKTQPLIVRERGSGSREAVERALADVGGDLAAFRVVGEMGSTQAVKQAVRAGVGVALISKRAVVDECLARLLHCVKVTDLKISRRCSPSSSPPAMLTTPICWWVSGGPTTPPCTEWLPTSPSWRPSISSRPWSTIPTRGEPSRRRTRCRTCTRWAARSCSRWPWRDFR